MKLLAAPQKIRSAVKDILRNPADERVVAVAFVGADALSYLPDPKGISVYCWPKPGGTNPNAVEDLLRAGVKVHFVERLHAKLYWSAGRGALIGSANLSSNALGEGGLRETMIRLPPRAIDVLAFCRSLTVVRDFDKRLRRLHTEHVQFLQHNPARRSPAKGGHPVPSFEQWFKSGRHSQWRLGWYDENYDPPDDALNLLEKETGSKKHATYMSVSCPNDLRAGVFTLEFATGNTSKGLRVVDSRWWVPKHKAKSRDKDFKTYPYIWFADQRYVPHGARPPFDCHDPRFQQALAAAITDSGALRRLDKLHKPSNDFIKRVERHYSRQPKSGA